MQAKIRSAARTDAALETQYQRELGLQRQHMEERRWAVRAIHRLTLDQLETEWKTSQQQILEAHERTVKELRDRAWADLQEQQRRLENSLPEEDQQAPAVETEDEEPTPAGGRPKRHLAAGSTAAAGNGVPPNPLTTVGNGSSALSTLITEAELYEDMQIVFPEEVSRAGFLRRPTKPPHSTIAPPSSLPMTAVPALDLRIEGHVGWLHGQRFVKGDRIHVVQKMSDGVETAYSGTVSGVSTSEITMRPEAGEGAADVSSIGGRVRMALGQIRAGRWILSLP